MRSERPVLAAAVFLAAGLSVIFCYGTSGSGLNAALPMSNSSFHLTIAAGGGAAIGGVILTIIGILCFIWAIFAALGWHWRVLTGQERARGERLAAGQSQNPPNLERNEPHTSSAGHRRFL